MGICHELDMLDMVWRRHHPRLATLAPAALRNWPTTNVFCRSWVCEGIDSMDQKSLVMTTTIGAIHSFIHGTQSAIRLIAGSGLVHAHYPDGSLSPASSST